MTIKQIFDDLRRLEREGKPRPGWDFIQRMVEEVFKEELYERAQANDPPRDAD